MQCDFEGCDRAVKVKKSMLCEAHYMQKKRGKPLKPLRGRAHNRKYEDGQICKIENCGRKIHSSAMCATHDRQMRDFGRVWEIGTRKAGRTAATGFEAERTCKRCGETKEWQRFCLGSEHLKDVCRDCNRAALSRAAKDETEPPKPNKNMEALLDFLGVERI